VKTKTISVNQDYIMRMREHQCKNWYLTYCYNRPSKPKFKITIK